MERKGENFFAAAKRDTMTRIYEEDRESFLAGFSKEQLIKELDEQGVYTATYRLIDTGTPMYVNMKATRMQGSGNRIIMGISIIDVQMRKQEQQRQLQRDRETLARVMALSEDCLCLYTVDPDTGRFAEYSATEAYASLGIDKTGDDFFQQSLINGRYVIHPEDLPVYLASFNRDNVMEAIRREGMFKLQYRLMINGEDQPVSLRIAAFHEGDEAKLVAGVRAWRNRR